MYRCFFALLFVLLAACSQKVQEAPLEPTLQATFNWQQRRSAPNTLFESQGAVVDGRLYIFGGFYNSKIEATRASYVYSPTSNRWQRIADMPAKITHAGVAVVGKTIWFVGGIVGDHYGTSTTAVWRYHTTTNRWSKGPPLPAPRGGGALVRVDNRFHFFGGVVSRRGKYVADKGDHWVLEFGSGRWRRLARMPNPRNHLSGAAVEGKIYALGGQHLKGEKNKNQKDVHRYDIQTDRWQRVADLPRPTGHANASTLVHNGRILVVGGVTQGLTDLANIIEYDPKMDRWRELSPLPKPRSSSVAGIVNNKLIVTTGRYNRSDRKIHSETWVGRWR